jgi:hypothetical protein
MGNILEKVKDKSNYSAVADVDNMEDVKVVDTFDYETDDTANASAGDFSHYELKKEIIDNNRNAMNYHYGKHRDLGDTADLTTGITVSPTAMNLSAGSQADVVPSVSPASANQSVTYKSDNESVATVNDSGAVTCVAEGTANITVTTKDGVYSAVCVVSVSE